MAYCFLGWKNALKTATLSAYETSPAGMDVTQLQNDQGSASMAWQVPGTAAGFLATFSAATLVQAISFHRTNLTANAIISATLKDATGNLVFTGVAAMGVVKGQAVILAPQFGTGKLDFGTALSLSVTVSDPGNPDGFINIPLMYVGEVWRPVKNISFASTSGRDIGLDEVVTRGGQEFPLYRWQRRRWKVDFQAIKQGEVYTQLDSLDGYSRMGGNVLFVPDPDSLTINYEATFGRLQNTTDLGWPYQAADARSWQTTVTERL